jgi:GT2 family glycosyltransferase
MHDLKVWLSYVSYPITTAAYLERALRRICPVTTIGPTLPQEKVVEWQLENLKLPFKDQDICTGFRVDMGAVLAGTDPATHPDLYLWVESVGGHYPQNLAALTCPKACYVIDTHLHLADHLDWSRQFDYVFVAQLAHVAAFRQAGINAHWLPLGCDPEIHRGPAPEKLHECSFVGSIYKESRRKRLLEHLNELIPVHYARCFWEEMAQVFASSKLVFNNAVDQDLNMRFFEVLATGSLLLADHTRGSGQDELFVAGEDYVGYQDATLQEVAMFFLQNATLREQIAARGQRLAHNAHTYGHRVDDLLAVVTGRKATTFSAAELRERSLVGVPEPYDAVQGPAICLGSARRSFVIPVLDYSPASEYNIVTLLDDLTNIEGEVIVVFNSPVVAEELKDHPRIDRYAIMKQNVGVARAWNLGLTIAATPTVFILNADLHLQGEAVDTLEHYLWQLPDAACVGPQGSFVDFALTRDYFYFDKGICTTPVAVDAVSGFFFAVKLVQFSDKTLRFEDGFTPCYFEEWDLGLQIRKAGLKSYVVPTTAYDHHWSGTIRALREIAFYERAETAGEILQRNRLLFLNKWRAIARRESCGQLLESSYRNYALVQVRRLIEESYFPEANDLLANLQHAFPEDGEVIALKRFTDCHLLKLRTNPS